MRLSRSALITALSIVAPLGLTAVQAQQPQPTGASAFTRIGNAFYIHSGSLYQDILVLQFYALDLTTSWSTSQPAWKSLPPGPYNAFHSAGYSADNGTLYTFGRDSGAQGSMLPNDWLNAYDLSSQTWSSSNPTTVADNTRRDFFAVTNPTNNKIYIVGGDAGSGGTLVSNVTDTFDAGSKTFTENPMPATGPQQAYTYAGVWVPRLSSMLIIGGQYGLKGTPATSLWVYNSVTAAWSTQATTGTFAYNRISPCAASNADGSLVVVYGGYIGSSNTGDPAAYILNTVNWTWTTISSTYRGRGNVACTVVDDAFIVWGGFYNNPSVQGGTPSGSEAMLLLNLTTQQWQTTYTPSAALAGTNSTIIGGNTGNTGGNTSGTGSSSKTGIPTGAIGGIAGGVVLALLLAALLVHRRNKRKHTQLKADTAEFEFAKAEQANRDHDHDYDEEQGHHSYEGRPRRPAPPPENLSPALYEFEEPPSPLVKDAQRIHSQQMQQLQQQQLQQQQLNYQQNLQNSPPQGFVYNQHLQTSPQMSETQNTIPSVDYNNSGGYSNFSTPSAVPLVAAAVDHGHGQYGGGVSPYQQQQQQQNAALVGAGPGSTYYPPPPGSLNQQQQYQGYSPYSAGGVGAGNDGAFPYKVPAPEAPVGGAVPPASYGTDGYHDSYRMSLMSNSTSGGGIMGKRPVSGPQGGSGFGSSTYEASIRGAPQSIPE